MDIFITEKDTTLGLSTEEIKNTAISALDGLNLKKVLLIPPDSTRYHSGTRYITNALFSELVSRGCIVDVLPAVGTHSPVTNKYGWNTIPDGKRIYFIPNPSIGLWIDRTGFEKE